MSEEASRRCAAAVGNDGPSCVVVVPAFDAEKTLESTVETIASAIPFSDIIIVNDGSTDGTLDLALGLSRKRSRTSVENLTERQGKAEAVRLALERLKNDYDIYVVLNAELEESARDVRRLIGPILAGRADLVSSVSERDLHGFLYRILRRIGRWAVQSAVARFPEEVRSAAAAIQYPASGEKAFTKEAFTRVVSGLEGGFGSGLGMTIDAFTSGLRVLEVPTSFERRVRSRWGLWDLAHRIRLVQDVLSVALRRLSRSRERKATALRTFVTSLAGYAASIYVFRLLVVLYMLLLTGSTAVPMTAMAFSLALGFSALRTAIARWGSLRQPRDLSDNDPQRQGAGVTLAIAAAMLLPLEATNGPAPVSLLALVLSSTFVLEAPLHSLLRGRWAGSLAGALAGIAAVVPSLLPSPDLPRAALQLSLFLLLGMAAGLAVVPRRTLQSLEQHSRALSSPAATPYAFSRPTFNDNRKLVDLARLGQLVQMSAGRASGLDGIHSRIATKIAYDLGFDYVIIKLVDNDAGVIRDFAVSENLVWDVGDRKTTAIANRTAAIGSDGGLVGLCALEGRLIGGDLRRIASEDDSLARLMKMAGCEFLVLVPIGVPAEVTGVVAAALRAPAANPITDMETDERVRSLLVTAQYLTPLLDYSRASTSLLQYRLTYELLDRFHHHYSSALARLNENASRAATGGEPDEGWNSPGSILRTVVPSVTLMSELQRHAYSEHPSKPVVLPSLVETVAKPLSDYEKMCADRAAARITCSSGFSTDRYRVPPELSLDLLMCLQHVVNNAGERTSWSGDIEASIVTSADKVSVIVSSPVGQQSHAKGRGSGLKMDRAALKRHGVHIEASEDGDAFRFSLSIPTGSLQVLD